MHRLEEDMNRNIVEDAINEIFNEKLKIECIVSEDQQGSSDQNNMSAQDLADIFGGKILKKQ